MSPIQAWGINIVGPLDWPTAAATLGAYALIGWLAWLIFRLAATILTRRP